MTRRRHHLAYLRECDPLIGRVTRDSKTTAVRYDYVHSMVDDHSRLAHCEILPDEKGATCAGFLTRAATYFAHHGINQIEPVMPDNHFSYRHARAVADVLAALGARHVFIRPHCPWQNGKVCEYRWWCWTVLA